MKTIKPIPTFSGYFASPDGIIWTQKRKGGNDHSAGRLLKSPRPLKAHRSNSGYMMVSFDVGGKVKMMGVHRLILMTFDRLPNAGEVACHYPDPTKTNNHINNLRWGTQADNAKDRFRYRSGSQEKQCTNCLEVKHISEFYADKRNTSDGRKSECKKCHMETSVLTRDKDKKNKSNREFMRRKRKENPKYGRSA
jgi:hypothetical protein